MERQYLNVSAMGFNLFIIYLWLEINLFCKIHQPWPHSNVPAASMKARLRWKVRRGSFRFLRKSFRRPVMAWISSTLLSTGTVLLRRNFSFSSFTVRSAPDSRYKPACRKEKEIINLIHKKIKKHYNRGIIRLLFFLLLSCTFIFNHR